MQKIVPHFKTQSGFLSNMKIIKNENNLNLSQTSDISNRGLIFNRLHSQLIIFSGNIGDYGFD